MIKEDRKDDRVCVAPRIRMEDSRKGVLRLSVTCIQKNVNGNPISWRSSYPHMRLVQWGGIMES